MEQQNNKIIAKPFVKWAGGKGALIKQLVNYLPNDIEEQQNVTYIEPFVGGGAMLFYMLTHYTNIKRAIINDVNEDLISCYLLIKNDPLKLITRVRDNILKSKEQKNIQPTKGGHKMVTCQNYVSLFYCQITSCPSDGGIS